MMKISGSNIKWVLAVLLGAGLLTGGFIFSGRIFASLQEKKPEFPARAALTPARAAEVGSEVRISFDALIPEHRKIISAHLQLPPQAAGSGRISFQRRNWRWHHGKWHFSGTMRGIKTGKSDPAKVVVELSPADSSSKNELFSVPLPLVNFTLDPAFNGDQELILADAADELPPDGDSSAGWFYWGIPLILLLLLAVILFFWWRRHPDEKKLTPWERADLALEKLQIALVNRDLTAAAAMIRLSDILRRYLQERYQMPVLPATTAEFIPVCRNSALIPESEKAFLAEFLQSADVVKFACGDAADNSVELTINRAAALIARTRPQPGNPEGA